MYKYEYETVHAGISGFGLGCGAYIETDGYKELIDKRAADGWRYVGFIPTLQRGSGQTEDMVLVFEKSVDNGDK